MVTRMRPAAAPSSGRRMTRVASEACFRRSSDEAGSAADGLMSMAGRLVSAMTGLLAMTPGRRPAEAVRGPVCDQRMPFAERSTTWAAFSLVIRFGPDGTSPPGIRPYFA